MNWLMSRLKERTSWDGAALIGVGLVGLLMPLDLVSYAAIAWGVITLLKSEQHNTFYIARRSYQAQDECESTDPWMDQILS